MGGPDRGLALLGLCHLVGVAMVCGNQDSVAVLVGGIDDGLNALVHALHSVDNGIIHTCVAHHIAIGEVAAQELELVGRHVLHHLLGDLLGLHGRGLLKGDHIGGDLLVDLQILVHLTGTVAVPEVGHVAELLGLGQGVLMNTGGAEDLGQGVLDDRGLDQVVGGDFQVAIILQHTGKEDAGVVAPVKLVKVLPVKGQRNLLGAVTPEVEEDHAVAVFDFGNGCAVPGHHKSGQILVDAAGFGTVGLNGFLGGGELTALALHMGVPAGLHHGPVGFIAIHGDLHTAAAGGDGVVTALGVQLFQHILQLGHILQSRGSRHVTAVQQDVAVDLLGTLLVGLTQHGDQVGDVGMDVAIGQQSQEVQGMAGNGVGQQLLPGSGLIQRAGLNGLADELRALGINLAAAQGIVSNLTVAHIVIGGQADGSAVGLQIRMGAGSEQMVQSRGIGVLHSIAAAAVALADTVHNDKYNGFFHK